MNRQQRRAEERRRLKPPEGHEDLIRVYWTPDEAEVVEEALDAYRLALRENLVGREPTSLEAWALDRSERMGQALRAALEGKPWFDVAANRTRPAPSP